MIAPSSIVSPQASRNRRTEENEGADIEERSSFDPLTICCVIEVFLPLKIAMLLLTQKRPG